MLTEPMVQRVSYYMCILSKYVCMYIKYVDATSISNVIFVITFVRLSINPVS